MQFTLCTNKLATSMTETNSSNLIPGHKQNLVIILMRFFCFEIGSDLEVVCLPGGVQN